MLNTSKYGDTYSESSRRARVMSAASPFDNVEIKSPSKSKRTRKPWGRFSQLLEPEVHPEPEPDETLKSGFGQIAHYNLQVLGVLKETELKEISERLTQVSPKKKNSRMYYCYSLWI